MQDVLKSAVEMHQAGQLPRAAQLYERVLALEPSSVEALHLLGLVRHQQGEHARAVELIGRAVALRPNAPVLHANLAEVYRALGQFERAAGCCRAALALRPAYPEALGNLGLALQGMGKRTDAVEEYRRALALRPDFAVVHNNLGNVLRELGRLDEAFTHFQRAVELDPNYAPARTNLGQMLLDRGRPEEALPHAQEAVRLQPDVAVMHHNLGNALRELARYVEAKAAYLEAIRLDPRLAKAHAHLGLALLREGLFDDALPWMKRAVELDPSDASCHELLGDLQLERDQFEEAIPCYERALQVATEDRFFAHLSLGWALQESGRLSEASEQFKIGEGLQPSAPVVQNYMGGIQEEQGNMAAAEAAYRKALALQPGFSLPLARLATLLRGKTSDEDVAGIEKWLGDPAIVKLPRAHLLFGLAQVKDARSEYARAAELAREANAIIREQTIGQRAYVPSEHERVIDNIIKTFTAGYFTRTAGFGVESRLPVFVFGLPRSGTTLIEQILASHSRVHGAGELRIVRKTFEAVPGVLSRQEPPLDCVTDLDEESTRKLAESHLEHLRTLGGPDAGRVTDKMPDNYMFLGYLATLFPRATFIHCRRDLRDVAVSCWITDFRSLYWACDAEHIASRFRQYVRVMEHWRSVLPVALHEVDYEETVSDLDGVARRLVRACGLDWEPACAEFHKTDRPIRTASVSQVRQPVYTRSVARWKNYQAPLADLFGALPPSSAPCSSATTEAIAGSERAAPTTARRAGVGNES
jgi:tetratricopeptide (TPR) repeat protein